jgi:hypothetical protein
MSILKAYGRVAESEGGEASLTNGGDSKEEKC